MTLQNYLKASNSAETLIKNYVVANASEALTEKILKGEKNINDCFNFIKGEAKKQAKNGCACMSDEEVFGLAIHYFEEDSIKAGEKVNASVNTNVNQNDDESEAIEVAKPVVAKPKKETKPKKVETENVGFKQLSLFDL